jgi:nitrogen regulatory protein PII
MKLVSCVINPNRFEILKKALWESGFRGVTVTEAQGLGLPKGRIEREDEFIVSLSPQIKVEIAVADGDIEPLVALIVETLRTGRIGDGKIFISALDEIVRVRTGERGEAAL